MIIAATSSAVALLFSLQAADAPQQAAPAAQTVPAATEAAPKEKITDRSHPDYVRCKREPVIGSRARTTKRCMTNRQWAARSSTGNRGARQIVEDLQVGSNSN